MEEEFEINPQRASLEKAIALLKPLRQHRQARAERQQREAHQALESSRKQLIDAETGLDRRKFEHQARRTAMAEEHLNLSISLEDVGRWHDRERRMLDHLMLLRHEIRQRHALIQQQEEQLRRACMANKQAQRAVEKLACFAEVLNDEG